MMRYLVIILLCVCSATAGAQSFTTKVQTPAANGAKVTIHQSKEIDALVNGVSAAAPAPAKPAPKPVAKPASDAAAGKTTASNKPAASTAPTQAATATAQPQQVTPVQPHKEQGYRVQAFSGGNSRKDKVAAQETGSKIKAAFPDQAVYVHFFSPRWVCRVGNFRTYEEAKEMLTNIQNLGMTGATIVKGQITVY